MCRLTFLLLCFCICGQVILGRRHKPGHYKYQYKEDSCDDDDEEEGDNERLSVRKGWKVSGNLLSSYAASAGAVGGFWACVLLHTIVGLFLIGLLFGIGKAIIGLCCSDAIGVYGLSLLIDIPRPIPYYYEAELRNCKVVYDYGGWPIHPETRRRTVRIMSRCKEFWLNIVFFLILPFGAIVFVCGYCTGIRVDEGNVCTHNVTKIITTKDVEKVCGCKQMPPCRYMCGISPQQIQSQRGPPPPGGPGEPPPQGYPSNQNGPGGPQSNPSSNHNQPQQQYQSQNMRQPSYQDQMGYQPRGSYGGGGPRGSYGGGGPRGSHGGGGGGGYALNKGQGVACTTCKNLPPGKTSCVSFVTKYAYVESSSTDSLSPTPAIPSKVPSLAQAHSD